MTHWSGASCVDRSRESALRNDSTNMKEHLHTLQNDERSPSQEAVETIGVGAPPPVMDEAQPATMRGDLEQIRLTDVLQTLTLSKMEGVLRLRNPLQEQRVYYSAGHVQMRAPHRHVLRRLGQSLLRAGLVDAEILRSALTEQRRTGAPLGQILVREGSVRQEHLDEALAAQASEDLFALFTWHHGSFEFFRADELAEDADPTRDPCPRFEVHSLLLEVARRQDEWDRILADLQSLDEVPALQQELPDDACGAQTVVVDSLDGRSTYRQLAEKTSLGLFEFARGARELAAAGVIAPLSDEDLVEVAGAFAGEGAPLRAAVLLQTLRDRQGVRAEATACRMAAVFTSIGARDEAATVLLDAAQRTTDVEQAVVLARQARSANPADVGALHFLRSALESAPTQDLDEFESVTLDLLDALIAGGFVTRALEILDPLCAAPTADRRLLLRRARALQKGGDRDGAVADLVCLAERHLAAGDRASAVAAYSSALRVDGARKDVRRALAALRRTRLGRVVRVVAASFAALMIAAAGFVWFGQRRHDAAVHAAMEELNVMLSRERYADAREVLSQCRARLGECEALHDMASRVAFAETAGRQRAAKLQRQVRSKQMRAAAIALQSGEVRAALELYARLAAGTADAGSVAEIVGKRLQALAADLKSKAKKLAESPTLNGGSRSGVAEVAQLRDQLRAAVSEADLRAYRQLRELTAVDALPDLVTPEQALELRAAVTACAETFRVASRQYARYDAQIAQRETERRLDPIFREAAKREAAHDFEGALDLYRQLLDEGVGGDELRAHFRARAAHNAEICALRRGLNAATDRGDRAAAVASLVRLRAVDPDVPFDALVRLPMQISSQPPGAAVFVDDVLLGDAPVRLQHVPAESAQVRLELAPFAPTTAVLHGEAVESWLVSMQLPPTAVYEHGHTIEVRLTSHASGDLLVVDRSGNVTRMDPTLRSVRWTFSSGDLSGFLSPAILAGGYAIVSSLDGPLRFLDVETGSVAWSLPDMPCVSAPVLCDRRVACATVDGRLHAIDAESRQVVSTALSAPCSDDLASWNGAIFCVGAEGTATSWTEDLKLRWTRSLDDVAAATIDVADGRVVVGDDQGVIYGLDAATGDVRWTHRACTAPLGRAQVRDGTLFITTAEQIVRLRVQDGAVLAPFPCPRGQFTGGVYAQSSRLIVPTDRAQLQVIDRASGQALYHLDGLCGDRLECVGGTLHVVHRGRVIRRYPDLP